MVDFKVDFSENISHFALNMGEITVIENQDVDYYDGIFQITPSNVDQILNTEKKYLVKNILVKAIPQEYGLITYDQNRTITIT